MEVFNVTNLTEINQHVGSIFVEHNELLAYTQNIALACNTPVLTRNGLKIYGKLQIGDSVYTMKGLSKVVIDILQTQIEFGYNSGGIRKFFVVSDIYGKS